MHEMFAATKRHTLRDFESPCEWTLDQAFQKLETTV
jgi:hypothetical protein